MLVSSASFPRRSAQRGSGSLVWKSTVGATEALANQHRAEGATIELLERRAIRAAEPHLRNVPEVAAFSADDLAISPLHVTETLVRGAIASGAVANWGQEINGIEASGTRVTGLRVANQMVAADIVIVAAGPGTNLLTSALGIDVGLEISPVLLLRCEAEHKFIDRILCGPDLEIRQTDDNALLLVEGYVDLSSENGTAAASRQALDIVKRDFDVPGAVSFHSASVGARPMFSDGLPRLGFVAEIDGLYVAVGHPGVILAPLLGRLAAEEIIAGKRSPSSSNSKSGQDCGLGLNGSSLVEGCRRSRIQVVSVIVQVDCTSCSLLFTGNSLDPIRTRSGTDVSSISFLRRTHSREGGPMLIGLSLDEEEEFNKLDDTLPFNGELVWPTCRPSRDGRRGSLVGTVGKASSRSDACRT